MKLVLCRSRSIASPLIRLACWSSYSHSAIYDPETGYVWDSTFMHGGVRKWKFSEWKDRYTHYELRDSGIIDIDGARAWMDDQVGKPYDWTALLGIFFRQREWQRPDWWFCSEFSEMARSCFGIARFRADARCITPGHQEMAL